MPAPASTITPRHQNVHSNAMTTYNTSIIYVYIGQTDFLSVQKLFEFETLNPSGRFK